MSNFEWQTEDDFSWDDDPQQPNERGQLPRWLLVIPILLLAMAAAGFALWRNVQQQVVVATEQAESEALASARLLVDSAENDDLELINNLLSGRDPTWTEAQRTLSASGHLFDRSAFGLTLQDGTHAVGNVMMGAGLDSAEITSTIQFTTEFETVTLELTNTYRKGERAWLLAPPDREFWGDTITEDSNHSIELVYPARDRDIVLFKLLPDLSATLSKARLSISSPDLVNTPIKIRFRPDPALLIEPQHAILPGNQLQVDMATPSLVGLPTNLRSYLSLRKGYATQLMQIVLVEYGKPPVTARHVNYQLAELELANPPQPPPIPYPDAHLIVGCDAGAVSTIYRGDLATGGWTALFDSASPQLVELPDQRGVVVVDLSSSNSTLLLGDEAFALPRGWEVVSRYQDNDGRLHLQNVRLNDAATVTSAYLDLDNIASGTAPITPIDTRGFVQWSPSGELALVYDSVARNGEEIRIIDHDGIAQASLIRDINTRPFWAGDTLVGWRSDATTYQLYDFMAGTVREWLTITDLRQLLPMSEQLVNPSLRIIPAPTTADPHQLIVQVDEGPVPRHLLVHNVETGRLDYLGQLSFSAFSEVSASGRFVLGTRDTPNGDPISGLRLIAYDQLSNEIDLYPISTYAQVRSPQNDENWLLLLDAGTLRLLAPTVNHEEFMELPDENCRSAAWVVNSAESPALGESTPRSDSQSVRRLSQSQPIETLDLSQYQWENRLVLLFADTRENEAYRAQLAALSNAPVAMNDRDLVVLHLFADGSGYNAQSGVDFTPDSVQTMRDSFGVGDQPYALVLIGKDGTVKRRELAPIPSALLFEQIDQMPMRQQEMQDGG